MSYLDKGPLLAQEFLNKNGIHLIIEAHLPKTLLHERSHIVLHLDTEGYEIFFDELAETAKDELEKQADELASESLIAKKEWDDSGLSPSSLASSIIRFAERLRISPSIPGEHVKFQTKDYKNFPRLFGNGKVRSLFTEPS